MNRGYSSLRFASFYGCKKVFGFEIHPKTYDMALYNFKLNKTLSKKIYTFNFGLSNRNSEMDLYYLNGADGISTTKLDFTNISNEWKLKKDKIKTQKVNVKKSSEIINKIINEEKINSKIVLKIDTEGSEYDILTDLIESNIINKIDIIIGEGHVISDMKDFSKDLFERNFIEVENTLTNPEIDQCYDFVYIKKELIDVWDLNE